MTYNPALSIQPSATLPLAWGAVAPPAGPDAVLLEARRILDEVREALEQDVAAAHLSVIKLASVLHETLRNTPQGIARGGLAPWQLRRMREHVAANLGEHLPIGRLAALVRLSSSHFTRAFRVSTGMSPHAYIVRERLEEAKRLMLGTRAPLCEIALICGLADQAHLTRLFTQFEGLSPAAWRRLHMDSQASAEAA